MSDVIIASDEMVFKAIWLRSQYLGTDYPHVCWQDASLSEQEAWLRLAGKEPEYLD
jgi:hypothetical protein